MPTVEHIDEEGHSHDDRSIDLWRRHDHHAALPVETDAAAPVGWMHIVVVSLLSLPLNRGAR